jgi:hypothetical protein
MEALLALTARIEFEFARYLQKRLQSARGLEQVLYHDMQAKFFNIGLIYFYS